METNRYITLKVQIKKPIDFIKIDFMITPDKSLKTITERIRQRHAI